MTYRTAFITGASSGIGAALARRLAASGTEVALAARRQEQLQALADDINGKGGKARIYPLDVADPAQVLATMQRADDELGGIELVVANAGVGRQTRARNLTYDSCAQTLAVNVAGATATLTALLPRMVERGRGHLVGVSSLAGLRGLPLNATYCASKAFLTTFLEGMRAELREAGVQVTDVQPGFVRTEMTAKNKNMPLLIDADDAAERIVRGLEKHAPVIAFPLATATAMRSVRLIPRPIYERLVLKVMGKGQFGKHD